MHVVEEENCARSRRENFVLVSEEKIVCVVVSNKKNGPRRPNKITGDYFVRVAEEKNMRLVQEKHYSISRRRKKILRVLIDEGKLFT